MSFIGPLAILSNIVIREKQIMKYFDLKFYFDKKAEDIISIWSFKFYTVDFTKSAKFAWW